MGKVIALAVMLALASCGTPGSFCAGSAPIYLSAETAAAMTTEEKRQVVAHNETWEAACK